jgi:hypothetical protein
MNIGIRLAGAFVGILLIASCSHPSSPSAAPGGPAAAEKSAGDLDVYHQTDLAFFDRFKLENALTLPPPGSISVAANQSTAVIVAEVAGVEVTRVVIGETARDQFSKVGVVLRPVEVLSGALRPELNGRVVVELLISDGDTAAAVESLKSSLPTGRSVWFLHWLGGPPPGATVKAGAPASSALDKQLYGLVSMQGVFAQGADRVVSAVAEEERGPTPDMAADGMRFTKLSELVAHIRALR